ncbi:hypothetical protein ANO14919_132580 [Xylariales sp. No.14919]|nr:hypothetical protein F5X98DRAFT_73946 [Xylaria grammica]GAW23683.1 hypothetical protein ANO14919_132580 [Xylariales sp. No.14919]
MDSRQNISLATANGYYDQALAVPQGVINSSFERLFGQYSDVMSRLDWDDDDGDISAELYPSQLLIPGDVGMNLSKIYHLIRFKSGQIRNRNGLLQKKVDNWVVAVACDLDAQFIKRKPDDKETPSEKRHREFIEKEFDIPGDYRIERLYAKLSSANWNNFDMEHSKFFNDDGKEITFDEWEDEDEREAARFQSFCNSWARSMERRGLTTLGLKITLPDDVPTQQSTFTPVAMLHQIYPYHDAAGNVETGFTPNGNANCLLYLEKVKGGDITEAKLPDAKQLGFSGNFSFPDGGGGGTPSGTFVVSQQLVLQHFLLPQLQGINEASSIYAGPVYGDAGGWGYPTEWGFDPDYPDSSRSVYEFKPSPDGKSYTYHKECTTPDEPHFGTVWMRTEHWSKANTTLTWEPRGTKMKLVGNCEYCRAVRISGSASMSDPEDTFSREYYTASWSISIGMQLNDGALEFAIIPGDDPENPWNMTATAESDQSDNLKTGGINEKKFPKIITATISKRIETVRENLAAGLQQSGKFVYTGTGQLNFSNAMFTENGSVVADVTWKTIQGGGRIIIKPPQPLQRFTSLQGIGDKIGLH